ncbi:hypothetical protein BH11MYX4_BH11MYX4_63050 [soil metagenome]
MRHVFSFCAAAGLSLVALVSACGGASETSLGGPAGDGGATSDGSDEASSSGASGGTSGTSGGDGGGGDAAPAESPFTGAPAYVPTTGRNTFKPGEHPGTGNPSKRACFDCHGGSGPGPDFFAAGSVFKDAAGTMAAPQVEIRLRDGAGNAVSTYSDTLGNFVVTAQAASKAGITFPLHAGARNAATTNLMSAAAPNGNCNNTSCHGGAQGWIHVP